MKENCHNSRTSDDIDMKLGPVTKLDKWNKITSKNFNDDDILKTYDVIVIFPIYGQLATVWKPDSRCIVYCLKVKVLFLPKNADFLQKNADINKIKEALLSKGIFSETSYVCIFTYQILSF